MVVVVVVVDVVLVGVQMPYSAWADILLSSKKKTDAPTILDVTWRSRPSHRDLLLHIPFVTLGYEYANTRIGTLKLQSLLLLTDLR